MENRSGILSPRKMAGGLLMLLLGAVGWVLWKGEWPAAASGDGHLQAALPRPRDESQFVTSRGCRDCHPRQYRSWHASYHRTMTQPATPETVRGDFENVTLELRGCVFQLSREGDRFWVELPDLDYAHFDLARTILDPDTPRIKWPMVMTTGSHHFQVYWLAAGAGNLLRRMPFVYLIEDERWVPVEDAVLAASPGSTLNAWNEDCLRCHTTGPLPNTRYPVERAETQVAELGIACEACHAPGAEHAKRQRKMAAAKVVQGEQPDSTIVLPTSCDHRSSAQICGQCHSLQSYKGPWNDFLASGFRYLAGGELSIDRYVIRPPEREPDPAARAACEQFFRELPGGQRSEFWDEFTPRVAGREYNGLLESACFLRGELSCVSCHSMHDSDPNDQLASDMVSNQACYKCHAEYEQQLEKHTHHKPDSAGSVCYNCHMPYTSYSLLTFTRSHRIGSPSVTSDARAGRPNACVLCHLDQTLPWAGEHLTSWYGQPEVPLDESQRSVAASVLYALRGDACQRAVVAWHARCEPARAVSGSAWMTPLVTRLLTDPYAAVRYQAGRTLKTLPGLESFPYDYIAPEDVRAMRQQQLFDLWKEQADVKSDRRGLPVLLDDKGQIMQQRVQQLLETRDKRAMQCVN